MMCCQGSFLDCNVATDEPEDADEACESTKSRSCCAMSLKDATSREVATLCGGGGFSCRHI
eukprot:8002116-Prorocentrum_lima.AAC.1